MVEGKAGGGQRFSGGLLASGFLMGWMAGAAVVLAVLGLSSPFRGRWDALPILLAGGAALGFVPFMRWRQTVDVFDDHLVWTRWLGTRTVSRSELSFARRVTRANTYRTSNGTTSSDSRHEFDLGLQNGKTLTIVGLEHPQQLEDRLRGWFDDSDRDVASQSARADRLGGWQPPAGRARRVGE
jgi:hypothetical protein